MDIRVRKIHPYFDVVIKHGDTTMDLGLMDVEQIKRLLSDFESVVDELSEIAEND